MLAEGRDGIGERPKRPFLDYRAFAGLAAGIPLVLLLTSRLGDALPSPGHFAGSALATGVCTLLVGGLTHLAINAGASRLAPVLGSSLAFYAALTVIGLFTIIASMSILLPQLIPLCPVIEGRRNVLTMQAVAIGTLYVAVSRIVALMSDRARVQTAFAHQSEIRALHSRIETLKTQMNPHFLFNALNSVASLIPDDPKLAETTVERIAGILQYTLLASQREFVALEEELSAVRDYLDIEDARFDGCLHVTIDVSPDLYQRHIPPLLLQPLVENAVLHGLAKARSGEIKVRGRAEEGAMVLTVTDDGVGPGQSGRQGNRMGLGHLRERLALTYGDNSTVVVREAEGGGFECELRIPDSP